MSPAVIAVLKVVIIEGLAGLVVASFVFDRDGPRLRRSFDIAFVIVGLAAVLGYFNFGAFRFQDRFVNSWEQYHFFLGSKYFRELRYDGLYEASLVAMNEIHPGSMDRIDIRSLQSFELEAPRDVLRRAESIKSRFSPQRWQAFSEDVFFFFAELHLPATGVLQDHGNTGSPAWAMAAWPLTAPFAARRSVLTAISFVDVVLMVVLFFAICRSFGARTMVIAVVVTTLVPRVYEYLGGSILRLDWFFALGMVACCLGVKRYKTAGVFIAWAIASKPFCALFALALGCSFIVDALYERRVQKRQVELVVAAALTLAAIVATSSLTRGGPGVWLDYGRRINLNLEEKYYANNHSFRDVFLQLAHDGPEALVDWTPRPVAASLYSVDISESKTSFMAARLVLIGLLIAVAAGHRDELFAFSLGAFWVYVAFATNMYYWQMLALPSLAFAHGYQRDVRRFLYLLFVCVFLMASYVLVVWQVGANTSSQGYFGSYWLALFCCVIFAVEGWSFVRRRKIPRESTPGAVTGAGIDADPPHGSTKRRSGRSGRRGRKA